MKYTGGLKKLITLSGWEQFFKVLTKKEIVLFFIFLILFISSGAFLLINFYLKNTKEVPAPGGSFVEVVVGSPRFINPIYADQNDVDRDLVELLFAGLMKYNSQGQIVNDIVQNYEIEEDGRIYKVYLKENVFWSDGKKLTADDVIFTIKTIQNPELKSPLRTNWLGVEVEKLSDYAVRFQLKKSYGAFLERLTLKILPKHIWENIPPQKFPLAIYNLEKPIGSGPYQLKKIKRDHLGYIKSLILIPNPFYHGQRPFIKQITFKFVEEKKRLLFPENDLISLNFPLPRYFAVFFNPAKSEILKKKEVRQALNYATNKKEIIEKVLGGQGEIIHSPILPKYYGYQLPEKIYEFDLEKVKYLLEKVGFNKTNGKFVKIEKGEFTKIKNDLHKGDRGPEVISLQICLGQDPEIYPEKQITGYFGSATKRAVIRFQEKYAKDVLLPWGFTKGTGFVGKTTRTKLNELCFKPPQKIPLKISLITVKDPILEKVANLLKSQWEKLGIEVQIEVVELSQLREKFIKPRNYEALLFGQVLGIIPDPFPFWHSSQINDPGLNLAKYQNKKADRLLEKARITMEKEEREDFLTALQNILIEDAPAIFLYSQDYIYLVPKKIKGIKTNLIVDPSKRFSGIENWYIKTKRIWTQK